MRVSSSYNKIVKMLKLKTKCELINCFLGRKIPAADHLIPSPRPPVVGLEDDVICRGEEPVLGRLSGANSLANVFMSHYISSDPRRPAARVQHKKSV